MSDSAPTSDPVRRPRKSRSDGDRSRATILREAARLATIDGIGGLSINRLAEAVGMSKSGLFAHFGSKEELQLATIESATAVFTDEVIEPATAASTGLERLQRLAENFLRHVESGVYPGGCFFASVAAEMDTHPGPVRDLAVQMANGWFVQLQTAICDGQAEGSLDPAEDPQQLAFELNAFMLLANAQFVVSQESTPIDRGRRAIERRIAAAAHK